MCGNIDAGMSAAHIPIKAMASRNTLKFVAYDEENTVIDSNSSPMTASLGKSNLSATGPRKKKETEYNNDTMLNENRAWVMAI